MVCTTECTTANNIFSKNSAYNHPVLKLSCMPLVHFPNCYWQRWSSCRRWPVWTLSVWRCLLLCFARKYCSSHQPQEHRRGSSQRSPHCGGWEQEETKKMSCSLLQEWLWNSVVDQWGLGKRQELEHNVQELHSWRWDSKHEFIVCGMTDWLINWCHTTKLNTLPLTAKANDPDPIAPVTNSVCDGVTITTHVYVPLSTEELGGENTNWAINTLVFTLIFGGRVTRPLTPENNAPSFVHVLFTTTSLSVTPPSKVILQLRVILLPV